MAVNDLEKYDLCVIGCGPGGFAAAMRALDLGKGIKDALKTTHPHPTMSEGIQECLRLLLDKSIYKCRVFPNQAKIRTWRPDG